MSFFKKIFGSNSDTTKEAESSAFNAISNSELPVDEQFTFNFKKNGGKFIYCENQEELLEQFENILEENDWFESQALCYDPTLHKMLQDNNLQFENLTQPVFFLAKCEGLIAKDGSILLTSNQIRQSKPHELPANMIIVATTSQILKSQDDGMGVIKNKYTKTYPNNITTIKYFEKVKEEDFLHYGSAAKNLYLLLLEDL